MAPKKLVEEIDNKWVNINIITDLNVYQKVKENSVKT